MIGAIIRKHRLEQNLSQTSLCEGICAVSYLSKIEVGHVSANEEIIDLILKRLGIDITSSSEEVNQFNKKLHTIFEEDYYGRFDEMYTIYNQLKSYEFILSNSHLAIEWHLIAARITSIEKEIISFGEHLDVLESYKPYFKTDHTCYYYYLKGLYTASIGALSEALGYFEKSVNYFKKGVTVYQMLKMEFMLGNYVNAIRLGEEAYKLLMDEGNIHYMIEAVQLLAAAYSNLHQIEASMNLYNRLLQMGLYLKRDLILYGAYYNIGATYLASQSYEKALYNLKKVIPFLGDLSQWHWFITYQKLVLCDIGLENYDNARVKLSMIKERLVKVDFEDDALLKSFNWLFFFENADKPYSDPKYLEVIRETYEVSKSGTHHGYKLFYGKYLIEALKANRKYKEALEIEEQL